LRVLLFITESKLGPLIQGWPWGRGKRREKREKREQEFFGYSNSHAIHAHEGTTMDTDMRLAKNLKGERREGERKGKEKLGEDGSLYGAGFFDSVNRTPASSWWLSGAGEKREKKKKGRDHDFRLSCLLWGGRSSAYRPEYGG